MTEETVDHGEAMPPPQGDSDLAARAAVTIDLRRGQALLVAGFADLEHAKAAYETLRQSEAREAVDIDGVLVVKADDDGRIHVQKLTDHTSRHGLAWGAVGGAALALLFPPSILVGLAVGGLGGATMGKLYGLARKDAVTSELAGIVAPGTSAIVAIVAIDAVDAVRGLVPEAAVVVSRPVDETIESDLTPAGDTRAGATPADAPGS